MPEPTDAHRKLTKFVGAWRGEEVMHPSLWAPQGNKAIGRMENRLALDGFAVLGEYEQECDGTVTFRGHAVHTYDAQTQSYVLHWFDSMGTPANVFRGRFEGETLTLVVSGTTGQSRLTYDFSEAGILRSRTEMSQTGEQWTTFMEGTYHRSS